MGHVGWRLSCRTAMPLFPWSPSQNALVFNQTCTTCKSLAKPHRAHQGLNKPFWLCCLPRDYPAPGKPYHGTPFKQDGPRALVRWGDAWWRACLLGTPHHWPVPGLFCPTKSGACPPFPAESPTSPCLPLDAVAIMSLKGRAFLEHSQA